MSLPVSPARRLSAENRREQIMRAAARLFVERGFEGVSMGDLAQELKTSRPTVYTYFPSTESILDALLQERLQHLPERLAPLLECAATSFSAVFHALLQERELLLLLNSGGGPHFRARRKAFLDAIESRLNLRELGQAKSASLGYPRQPLLLPIILTLLSSLAYEQVTQPGLDADELSGVLDSFIAGGIENAVLRGDQQA